MSQNNVDFTSNPTGTELMDDLLLPEQQNFLTCNSGISRPSYAVKGTLWLDTSVTPHLLKQYDGSADVTLGTINPTTHAFTPTGIDGKQDALTFDNTPTLNSTNPVKSGGVYNALLDKVDLTGDQTVAGVKTFSSSPLVPTPVSSDNSTKPATTAFIAAKFQVVSSLPANPDANTFYFVTGA